ncbi:MAG: FKBP-type peptidyl-prolyl cis-trans isomerase [Nevskiaceae bacterium]|jgi:FKBP-type peptidyl-prolyl cis-trans isomerase FkpA|nr:FKBP-type peptidyl-prolyl cis-trans isomerase [Nevskiaceae bacterium]
MRIKVALLIPAVVASLVGCTQAAQPTSTPTTDDEKALYAVGAVLAANVRSFNFTDEELKMVLAGFSASAQDKSVMDQDALEAAMPALQALETRRITEAAEKEKAAGAEFLAKAAAEQGATKTESGLVIRITQPGSGEKPTAEDVVNVHYTGKFTDGKVFDSSVERGEPIEFPLSGVIPCWTEAVQLMAVGSKAQVVCPSDLAYGDEGRPPQMRGGATLVFDIELLGVTKAGAAGAGPGGE